MKKLFFIIVTQLLLISCVKSPMHKSTIDVNRCQQNCVKEARECNILCKNSCYKCSKRNKHIAVKGYKNYVNEKFVEGGVISRDLDSYRAPLHCLKVSCNCVEDFNVCKIGCVGKLPH